MTNGDSDIKIFTPQKASGDEDLRFIEEMNHQRANGNTALAKKLGKQLADFLVLKTGESEESFFTDYPYKPKGDILYRVMELAVFSAEHRLEALLGNQLLCATAVNSFYDSLIKLAPEFYEKVSSGTAFTFYCLDVRESTSVPERIGQSFAMLCGDEKNPDYFDLGVETFNTATYETGKIFRSYAFAE